MSNSHRPVKLLVKPFPLKDVLETDTIQTALELLDGHNIGAVPVRSEEGTYTGVLSKTDIASLRFFEMLKTRMGDPARVLVIEIMNKTPPVYVMEHESVQTAVSEMYKRHIHRIFVADSTYQLVGVVSTTDILRYVMLDK